MEQLASFDLAIQPMLHVQHMGDSLAFFERLGAKILFGSRDGDYALVRFGPTKLGLLAHPPSADNPEPLELHFESDTARTDRGLPQGDGSRHHPSRDRRRSLRQDASAPHPRRVDRQAIGARARPHRVKAKLTTKPSGAAHSVQSRSPRETGQANTPSSAALERAKGFEPSTPTLARLCSTPELRPLWRLARQSGRVRRAS